MKRETAKRIESFRGKEERAKTALGRERQYTSRIARVIGILSVELDPEEPGDPNAIEKAIALLVDAMEEEP